MVSALRVQAACLCSGSAHRQRVSCPLGAAGALTSGPKRSPDPCSGAVHLQAHIPGPVTAHPQGCAPRLGLVLPQCLRLPHS